MFASGAGIWAGVFFHVRFSYSLVIFKNAVVTICTTCFDRYELCIFCVQCIYVFSVILKVESNYIAK